jgi:hypothetical protein
MANKPSAEEIRQLKQLRKPTPDINSRRKLPSMFNVDLVRWKSCRSLLLLLFETTELK